MNSKIVGNDQSQIFSIIDHPTFIRANWSYTLKFSSFHTLSYFSDLSTRMCVTNITLVCRFSFLQESQSSHIQREYELYYLEFSFFFKKEKKKNSFNLGIIIILILYYLYLFDVYIFHLWLAYENIQPIILMVMSS